MRVESIHILEDDKLKYHKKGLQLLILLPLETCWVGPPAPTLFVLLSSKLLLWQPITLCLQCPAVFPVWSLKVFHVSSQTRIFVSSETGICLPLTTCRYPLFSAPLRSHSRSCCFLNIWFWHFQIPDLLSVWVDICVIYCILWFLSQYWWEHHAVFMPVAS